MLLTLEGLDGSGKSTAWEALQAADAVPETATFTREPTTTWYGEAVQRSIEDPTADPHAELFLYMADHAAHLSETVRPALAEGRAVISDRYTDSRAAYQGVSLSDRIEDPVAYVQGLHEPWSRGPDVTLYLDVDPATAAERAGATNKFETTEYLTRVREKYEQLVAAEPERFIRVDAMQSEAAMKSAVIDAAAAYL